MNENTGKTDREKVNEFLDRIQEFDEALRAEVLQQCATDPVARVFYLAKANGEL